MSALDDVASECRRHAEEGWTPEHDDTYRNGEMARAAGCYALLAGGIDPPMARAWPWSREWWKPGDARRMLVKAAALIVAEIERLDRASGRGGRS